MLVGCAHMWGCIVQREGEDGKRSREQRERLSATRASAAPSLSFYRKGSGDRRRQSRHTPASGSTASHSSPLPVGTQTSWCTFRGTMNKSHQHLLHSPETLQQHLKNNAYIVCNGFSTWLHEKQPHAQVASNRLCRISRFSYIWIRKTFDILTGNWKQQEFSHRELLTFI